MAEKTEYRIRVGPADPADARRSAAWTWEITSEAVTVRSGYGHATREGAEMTASLVLADLMRKTSSRDD